MPDPMSPSDEAEQIARLVALLDGLQRATGPRLRSQHQKTVACLAAEFVIPAGVPAALAHGVFATPRTFAAWVRFSNALSWDDRDPDIHGLAVKLLGVPGARLPDPDGSPDAQDFLLDDIPVFFAPDVGTTYAFMARKIAPWPPSTRSRARGSRPWRAPPVRRSGSNTGVASRTGSARTR